MNDLRLNREETIMEIIDNAANSENEVIDKVANTTNQATEASAKNAEQQLMEDTNKR